MFNEDGVPPRLADLGNADDAATMSVSFRKELTLFRKRHSGLARTTRTQQVWLLIQKARMASRPIVRMVHERSMDDQFG
jgi:hypothetical protein